MPRGQIDKPSNDLADLKIGANPSAEDEVEQLDEGQSCAEKVLDVCHYHNLQTNDLLSGDKKFLKKILKAYLATVAKKLKETDPAAAAEMKKTFEVGYKSLQDKIDSAGDDLEILVGSKFEMPDEVIDQKTKKKALKCGHGMGFGVWNADGMSLTVYFLKAGTLVEKV